MATFRRRGSKWHVQVRRTGHPSLTRSFTHKVDAEAWARKAERAIDTGDLLSDRRPDRTITICALLERYEVEVTPTKRGADQERYKLRMLKRHPVANCRLDKLTPSLIAAYRDERLTVVKPNTVRRELAILQHVLEVARREWNITLASNPVPLITLPELPRGRNRRLHRAEFQMLQQAAACSQTPYLLPIIRLAIETGMRRSELLALRWDNLDLQARTAYLPTTKNGHARTVPLSPIAIQTLHSMPRTSERVFCVTGNAVRLAWERLKRRIGITDLRFHDLRHEAISRFFELGLSLPEVALISGHRDPRQLMRYTHLEASKVAKKLQVAQADAS